VVLRTRNDAEAPFFHEVKNALLQLKMDPDILLDGEFYSKKIPFKTLNGYCNRKKQEAYKTIPPEHLASIEYYIFDCYFIKEPQKPFGERYAYLQRLLVGSNGPTPYLKLVPCMEIKNESDIKPLHAQFVTEGYEGIMIRNIQSPYKLKDRSNDLLKYKDFSDAEFEISGATTPLNGKEEGCIIWVLKVPNSDLTFTCRPRDTYESRKADWITYQQNPCQFNGKPYTVRYQETYDNGVPRFPTGIGMRYDI
jgi:DNA ligase-1